MSRYILFYLGNAPANTQRDYMDARYVRLDERRGPSLGLAVQLCSGAAAAEVLKLILKRGPVYPAPYYHQYDAYKCVYVRRKLRWGNRGPLQRLKMAIARRKFGRSRLRVLPSENWGRLAGEPGLCLHNRVAPAPR